MNVGKIFEYSLFLTILFCLGISIADTIHPELLPPFWYIPAIFSILFAITYYMFKIPLIEKNISEISGKIQASGFKKFTKSTDYYDALEIQLQSTESEILLTHIRNHPPKIFNEKSKYFTSVDSWLKNHPDGLVKRIAAAPNDDMKKYCEQENEKSEKTENYYFRFIKHFDNISILNVAIFDRRTVFITIPGGESQQTRGIFIDDPEVVAFCIDYFTNLWERSKTQESLAK